jgi:hypothetical protein
VQPVGTERRPYGNVEQNHRRERGLDALGKTKNGRRGGKHHRRAIGAPEHHPGIAEVASAAGVIAVEEGPLDRHEASFGVETTVVQRRDHCRPEIDRVALPERCARMEAERARQNGNPTAAQVYFGRRPAERPGIVPDALRTLAPPQIRSHG